MSSNPEAGGRWPAADGKGKTGPWRRWLAAPEASVLFVLVAIFLWMAARGNLGTFASETNRDSLARSISLQSIFAIGELLVILTGGIDLSLGSLIAFSGMLLARLLTGFAASGLPAGQATVLAVAIVLAFSLALGGTHAALIHHLRLPPFVVTLASMSMLRSGALLLNDAVPIPISDFGTITYIGNGKLYLAGTGFGLPVGAFVLLAVAIVVGALLAGTPIGRQVYALGSNEEATRLSGVHLFRVRLFVYGTCSLLGGLAGILYAGYSGQGDPSSGGMFELNAISAAVIGGASLMGGRGSVLGTILGAALLECILSMINLTLTAPALWRGMVVGSVLLLAVVFNQLRLRQVFRQLVAFTARTRSKADR